jgi:hypothetical protein
MLFIRSHDDVWETSMRAIPVLGSAPRIDLPNFGFGLFEFIPECIARTIRLFLGERRVDF